MRPNAGRLTPYLDRTLIEDVDSADNGYCDSLSSLSDFLQWLASLASTDFKLNCKRSHQVNEKDALKATLEPVLEEAEVGYQLYKEAVHEGVNWNAEEGAVRRKIDLYILPCFCLTQGLAFLSSQLC
ncbi:hypothetical protein DFH06DRAFT_1195965 [Mycena polygramma]|nr:hypothetical protein DFH06DRAFT_1195965 [Mycena polygramma]